VNGVVCVCVCVKHCHVFLCNVEICTVGEMALEYTVLSVLDKTLARIIYIKTIFLIV
jgi:hypothetical protein